MAKVTIIDVDLGQDIDDILSDDVKELTSKNQADLEKAIEEKAAKTEEKQQKIIQINQQERAKKAALAKIYAELLNAHDSGSLVPIDFMLEAFEGYSNNASAIILMLKHFMRTEHCNDYALKKSKQKGKSVYTLIPFHARTD